MKRLGDSRSRSYSDREKGMPNNAFATRKASCCVLVVQFSESGEGVFENGLKQQAK